MKKATRFIAVILSAFLMVFTLAACGNGQGTGSTISGEKMLKLGFVQLLENTAFEDMRNGFLDRLAELGYEDGETMELIYKNAQGDMAAMNTICQQLVSQKVDIIVTIATPPAQVALQTLQAQGVEIPLIFISVSDPLHAGLVTNMEVPDLGATGTQNIIPMDANFDLARKLTPDFETFGFLYTAETNSIATIKDAIEYCEANDIKYFEAVPSNSSEVAAATASLLEKCDAIFVPNDSVIQSVMTQVAQLSIEAGVALYGSSATMVEAGALATVSTADYEIGRTSADMAAQIIGGKKVSEVPVKVVSDVITIVNTDTAAALGIEIPADVLKDAVIITASGGADPAISSENSI